MLFNCVYTHHLPVNPFIASISRSKQHYLTHANILFRASRDSDNLSTVSGRSNRSARSRASNAVKKEDNASAANSTVGSPAAAADPLAVPEAAEANGEDLRSRLDEENADERTGGGNLAPRTSRKSESATGNGAAIPRGFPLPMRWAEKRPSLPRKMDIIPRTGDWNNGKLIDKDPARLFIPSSHSFLPGPARQWSRAPLRCSVAALFLRSAVSSFRSAFSLFETGDFRSSVFFFCAWNFCSNFCFLSSATIDDDDLTSPSARTSPNFFPYVLFFPS